MRFIYIEYLSLFHLIFSFIFIYIYKIYKIDLLCIGGAGKMQKWGCCTRIGSKRQVNQMSVVPHSCYHLSGLAHT